MKTKFLFRISLSIAFLLSITVSNWGQSVRNGRLVFASRAAYQQVFQQLTTQVNAYVEPAGEIQEGVEYDPYPTLAAFENSKPGFISLRKIALSDEYSQLRAGVDPDNLESKSLIFDPVAEAILNGNHVFQIADTIFYLPNSKRLITLS